MKQRTHLKTVSKDHDGRAPEPALAPPGGSLPAITDLLLARREYLRTGATTRPIRRVVERSWQRSLAYGIDPSELRLQGQDTELLAARRAESRVLVEAALPVLEEAHRLFGEAPHLLALGDREGLILWLGADPVAASQGVSSNLFEGASWHERDIGSNGLGTALAEHRPVILVGPEHLVEAYVGWTCIGIPVHDASGALAGAIDLSVPNAHVSDTTWGWILAVADQIGERLGSGVAGPVTLPSLSEAGHSLRGALSLIGSDAFAGPTHAQLVFEPLLSLLREVGEKSAPGNDGLGPNTELALRLARITVFIQDRELRYTWIGNPAPGFAPGDVLGKTDHELLRDAEEAAGLTALKLRVLETGRGTREVVKLLQPDGEVHTFDLTIEPLIGEPGTVTGVVCTAIDTTNGEGAGKPDGELESLSEFLGLVSHELRSPVTTVAGLAGVLVRRMEELDSETRRGTIEDIARSAGRLQRLVEDLLLLLGPPEHVEMEPVLLDRVLEQVCERHRRRFPGREVEVVFEREPLVVEGQPGWLEQVLENLLSNAEKYGDPATPTTVRVSGQDGYAEIAVLDRGPGITATDAEHIFNPFHRGERARKTTDGLGLGLVVCRRLVAAMGGEISAAPRDGGGAAFRFRLRLAQFGDDDV